MANPQAENGHTDIANEILEALWKVNLSPYETRILLYLLRKTYGWHKKTDRIALSQFSKDIGIDRRLVHRAIKGLSSKKMIIIYKDDKNHIMYGFQKNYENWKVSSKKMTVICRDDRVSSKEMTRLSSVEIPTKETIQKKLYKRKNILSDEDFLNSLKKKFTWIDFEQVMIRMDAWLSARPGRQKTRRFIVNWLNKIEKPLSLPKEKEKSEPAMVQCQWCKEIYPVNKDHQCKEDQVAV